MKNIIFDFFVHGEVEEIMIRHYFLPCVKHMCGRSDYWFRNIHLLFLAFMEVHVLTPSVPIWPFDSPEIVTNMMQART